MAKLNSHFLSLALSLLFLFLSPSSAHPQHSSSDPLSLSGVIDPLIPSYSGSPSSSASNSPLPSVSDSPLPSVSDSPPPSVSDSPLPSVSDSPPSSVSDSPPSVSDSDSPPSSSTLMGGYKGLFSKVFAFGDSYTDTGNSNFMGGMSGSSAIQKGMSNGHKVVDYLCDALHIPHLSPFKDNHGDFSHGANFAFGGSHGLFGGNGSIPHGLLFKGVAKALETQKEWFHQYVKTMACKDKDEKACREDIGKSLFWIGATGVNDYTQISGFSTFNLQRLADNCIIHISKLIKELLDMGAKNIVVHGLPPVGCLSSGISLCPLKNFDKLGCSLAINTAVLIHNRILQKMITRYHSEYPDAKILYADYWNAFLKIFMHPKDFNFEETVKACCGSGGGQTNFNMNSMCGAPGTFTCKDPSKFMSWDGIHLTEKMHQHISDLFLNQNFCKPSFAEAFKGKIGM